MARAKMNLSRAQNIFMPSNINSIVLLQTKWKDSPHVEALERQILEKVWNKIRMGNEMVASEIRKLVSTSIVKIRIISRAFTRG